MPGLSRPTADTAKWSIALGYAAAAASPKGDDHPEFPDAMAVFGVTDEQLSMHYFDSRGVYRVYAVSLCEGTWRFSRDAPGILSMADPSERRAELDQALEIAAD